MTEQAPEVEEYRPEDEAPDTATTSRGHVVLDHTTRKVLGVFGRKADAEKLAAGAPPGHEVEVVKR